MKKIVKMITIFITIFLVMLVCGNCSFGQIAQPSKKLGLFNSGNGRPTGYYTVGSESKAKSLPVIKIVEYQSNGHAVDPSKSNEIIYCLKNGVGFGADVNQAQTQDYTNFFDMRGDIDADYKNALPENSEYNKLMWLLDNICDPNNEKSVNKLLENAEIDREEFGDLAEETEDFKDVLEIIQQSAIWYITNKGDETHRPSEIPVFYVTKSLGVSPQNIENLYRFEDEIDSPVTKLYDYFIDNAENNGSYNYNNNSSNISLNSNSANVQKDDNYFYVGPYNVSGTLANISNAKITINDVDSSNSVTLVDSSKSQELQGNDITEKIKQSANQQFYIRIPLTEHNKKVKIEITTKSFERDIQYWSTDKSNMSSSQPVVIIEDKEKTTSVNNEQNLPDFINVEVTKTWIDGENAENRPEKIEVELYKNGVATGNIVELNESNSWKHNFSNLEKYENGNEITYSIREKDVPDGYKSSIAGSSGNFTITNTYIPDAKFDLSLRKFITKINDEDVETRVPDITQDYLKELAEERNAQGVLDRGKTARKPHRKDPLSVNIGDKVTYTIRIYNEGEIDGYAEEITDYLPEGLELIPQTESTINQMYRWVTDSNNSRIVKTDYLSKEQNENNLLTKFNKVPENGQYTISYKDVQIECRVVEGATSKSLKNIAEITKDFNKDNVPDRDSTPKNLDDTEKSFYRPETSTEGKGYEDDDDYEELLLIKKEFDVALRKFITAVNDKELKTGNKYDREPVVDVTPLLNGKTTASYKHTKKPVKVSIGDVVTYTIRVYNEGQVDGYVDEIVDHLPPELEFLPDDELNKKYLWTIDSTDETNRTIRTTYLSKERSADNILKGFNGEELAYKDIQVRCKVVPTAPMGKIITNIADITERSNDENIPDRDNEKKVELPPDDKLPDYKGKETNKDDLSDSEYHYEGQEDDDDFEKLIIERFDLALRKFITGVNDEEITNRIPEVDTTKYGTIVDGKEVTTMEYKHTKEPVRVSHNDIVIYTIRVYNEGTKSGYAAEIKDDIPDGLEYVKDNEINNEYGWVLYDEEGNVTTDVKKAVTIRTDYLSKEKEQTEGENLLKGFDKETMDVPDYRDVKVAFKVTEPNTSDRIITNSAQISKDTDENGDEVDDDDSTPDEWKGEDDEDTEKVYVKYFDLSLRKWVSQVILIEDGVQKEMDTGHYAEQDPEPVVKVELNKKRIENTIIKFRYQIRIKNEGEIEGYATEISDYIPEGLKFNQADNPKWKEENGKIVTDQLKDTLLQPGETATIEVTLTWINDENNLSQKVNVAEISEDDNPSDTPDIDSTPNNKKDGEDDIDDAPVVLTVVTGKIKLYISLISGIIAIIGLGTIIIKKYVI